MQKQPINEVLASSLKYFMQKRSMKQADLATKSGVGQTTISLYLNPSNRKTGASGKPASAKLTEVEMLADALEVNVWELLRDLESNEREAYEQIEKAFLALRPQKIQSVKTKSVFNQQKAA